MSKILILVCAIGLTILWVAGLGSPFSAAWLSWLDGVCALIGYGIAFRKIDTRGSIGLSVALFALWIIGMSTNGAPWQNWWTFIFGCGYLLAGLTAPSRPSAVTSIEETASDRYRKSA